MAKTLKPSIAPNLPLGPVEYEQRYIDQLLNVLRLYFNTIDNTLRGILENSGGRFINSPTFLLPPQRHNMRLETTRQLYWSGAQFLVLRGFP